MTFVGCVLLTVFFLNSKAMCTSPIEIKKTSKVSGRSYSYIVPCGKCPECLNTKQNDNAVLSYIEACKRGKLVFATLTYNNDTFPMRERIGVCQFEANDIDGGFDIDWKVNGFVSKDRLPELRRIFVDSVGEDFSKVLRSELFQDSSGKWLVSEVGASLRRNDFREYLKRARVSYERRHKERLPDFSYMAVGEYGELHHRPHFHVCFYGLEENIVRELLDSWTEEFGYIDVKTVQRFNSDPSHESADGL